MSRDADGFAQALPGAPPPWGLLGRILWGTLGAFAWFAVQFAVAHRVHRVARHG